MGPVFFSEEWRFMSKTQICVVFVFSMLSLGRILILDLVVVDFFMHSLPGMILLYLPLSFLHQRCFWMRYIYVCVWCSVDNIGYWAVCLALGKMPRLLPFLSAALALCYVLQYLATYFSMHISTSVVCS